MLKGISRKTDGWMYKGDVCSTIYVQQVAAEAGSSLFSASEILCFCGAMKDWMINDWEQTGLSLGDVHLAHDVRGKRATWLIERDVKIMASKKKKMAEGNAGCCFPKQKWLNSDG